MNVISLSSIPPRFAHLGPTLESLLAQSAPIDRIILNVPRNYRRFPDHDGHLPKVPAGVDLVVTDQDLGPATKLLPTLRAYRGQDVNILFCDDEWHYLPNWAEHLLKAARTRPNTAICYAFSDRGHAYGLKPNFPDRQPRAIRNHRSSDLEYRLKRIWSQLDVFNLYTSPLKPARRITKQAGYADIFEGFAGVLVRPEFFDDAVFDIPDKLWAVDDVWLSGHVARKGVPVWAISEYAHRASVATTVEPLHRARIDGLGRDDANAACIRYFQDEYGIWKGAGGTRTSSRFPPFRRGFRIWARP